MGFYKQNVGVVVIFELGVGPGRPCGVPEFGPLGPSDGPLGPAFVYDLSE